MVTIDYGDGACVSLEAGGSVLEASRQGGIAHADACGGRGLCTTCRVRVESGLEHCPAPDEAECQALAINGLPPGVRLACQLRPTGDIAVRVLIREHAMPSGAAPEAVLEQVAVLFVDIRGFTGFAEKQLPFDVSNVLNRYFDMMGVQVERHGGHILDYLGDGIMTLFRPGDEDPARRALRCAIGMRDASQSFCGWALDHFQTSLRTGIAVHAGRAVVGRFGYFRARHLNAVGDVLNLAARLEDLNKDLDTDILVTEPVAEAARDLAQLGRSFAMKVRGRATPVTAYEVLGSRSATIAPEVRER